MGKMRERMEQAKQAMAEQERLAAEKKRLAAEKKSRRGLTDDEAAKFGGKILDEQFEFKRVRIYAKGFVKVTVWPLGGGEFEKIVRVSGEANVHTKTGLGRLAAGVVTLGANTVFTSNKRGSIYLTIVTDKKTHVLTAEAQAATGDQSLKSFHKIVTTAESLIQIESGQSVGSSPVALGPEEVAPALSLADEIQKLNSLLTQGLINEEEFAQAKAKLLS